MKPLVQGPLDLNRPHRRNHGDGVRSRLRALACGSMLGLAAVAAQAQIYAGTDGGGGVVLSNFSSANAPMLLIAGEPPRPDAAPSASSHGAQRDPSLVARHATTTRQAPATLAPMIRDAASRHSLSESLLTAVIAVESGFDPNAVSPKGAMGLMQLMPATARRFGVKDAFAVRENLHAGAAYLRQLLTLFENDRTLALAAYNAGEGAVLRARGQVPPFAETRDYVARVLAYAERNPASTAPR